MRVSHVFPARTIRPISNSRIDPKHIASSETLLVERRRRARVNEYKSVIAEPLRGNVPINSWNAFSGKYNDKIPVCGSSYTETAASLNCKYNFSKPGPRSVTTASWSVQRRRIQPEHRTRVLNSLRWQYAEDSCNSASKTRTCFASLKVFAIPEIASFRTSN